MVGVVDEVVADERTGSVVIAGDVCGGDRDELPRSGWSRKLGGVAERAVWGGAEERGDEQQNRIVAVFWRAIESAAEPGAADSR